MNEKPHGPHSSPLSIFDPIIRYALNAVQRAGFHYSN